MSDFIAIDLGTTFWAAARIDEHGRAVIVPNAEGDPRKHHLLSVVWHSFGCRPDCSQGHRG